MPDQAELVTYDPMWLNLLVCPPLLVASILATAALWMDGPKARWAAGALTASFGAGMIALLFVWPAAGWGGAAVLICCSIVLLWWLSLAPSIHREWEAPLSRTPVVERNGDSVKIHNVRNFRYRSVEDFDEEWESRDYDLSKVRGMDLFISYWGPKFMAHTIASWEFEDGQFLAISIEVRKVRGESFSALKGFFRTFEIHYVVSDERDLIGLRAKHRREDVYLYRLTIQPATALAILDEYLKEMEELVCHPRWYNALTRNCTTATRRHIKHVSPDSPWDYRILMNGRLDELLYERGHVSQDLAFDDLRSRSAISEVVRATEEDESFSKTIRAALPAPRTSATL